MQIANQNEKERAVREELKFHFKPEFLNRLDDIVIFNSLDLEAITEIVDIMFTKIENKVKERNISISLTDEAKKYIAEIGFDVTYGARPLKRALYEVVEDRLAELILEDRVTEGSQVVFDVQNNEVVVDIVKSV